MKLKKSKKSIKVAVEFDLCSSGSKSKDRKIERFIEKQILGILRSEGSYLLVWDGPSTGDETTGRVRYKIVK